MRACVILVLFASFGCGPSVPVTYDGGVTRLEDDEASALAGSFLDARDTHSIESCRCAGDVPFCRADTPPLSGAERSCLDDHVATGGAAFREVIPCLTAAADAFVACSMPLACPDVSGRTACKESYTTSGNACFANDPALGGLLASCLPESKP